MKNEDIVRAIVSSRNLIEAAGKLGVNYNTLRGVLSKRGMTKGSEFFEEVKKELVAEASKLVFDVSKGDPKIVGCLPDLHFPFSNWEVIEWIFGLFQDNNVGKIIQLGDLQDQCVWSRFGKDGDFDSPAAEWHRSKKDMIRLHEMFPDMTILTGNHDTRIAAKALEAGVPSDLIKGLDEVFNFDGWEWIVDPTLPYIYDGIAYAHGDNLNQTVNAALMAEKLGMSVMTGHTHKLRLAWSESSIRQVWGATAGCAVDTSTYGMRYAKKCADKVNLGCAIVDHGNPFLFAYPK
jgi:predicted phosphodiesterase